MRPSIIAAVLMVPAVIDARPVAAPDTKMVLNQDTFSTPDLGGAPMPAEHTSLHHFAGGVTDEGFKRIMGGRDNTLATPKDKIIVHPYRPFADRTKEREHEPLVFGGSRKVHPRGFHQEVRNTDNTERPHPDDHHLAPKIGTPKNARGIDDTERPTHPSDHHLGPKIGTPKNARATHDTKILSHPNGHLLPPKIGTPINARAVDNTERPHPNDHHLGPKIGTPMNARAMASTEHITRPDGQLQPPMHGTPIDEESIENAERPHPDDHHLGFKLGTPKNTRDIDNADSPLYPNGHYLGPKIGTPINAKREETEELEETEEIEETEEYDGLDEMIVDLPIPSDYYFEEFDDLEETPMDLPILSDYYPDESDLEDARYVPTTPGDQNTRRPGRLAGPPYPCAGPLHFNGTTFKNTINGTVFNSINGTAFNNTTNGTVFNNAKNITDCFEQAVSEFEEPKSTLKRRGSQNQAAEEKADREKSKEADGPKQNPNVLAFLNPKAKSKGNIMEHAPALFDYFRDPFNKAPPFEEDKKWTEDFLKKVGKPKHPLHWVQPGVEDLPQPKEEPGYEYPRGRKPKDTNNKPGFDQGDAWKTDYFQNGVWGQPRVPNARRPYWTEGNPVY
ncbi:hypothetical protein V493_02401 [Pseudogymnoascus sp. VKM F-4281 (FW-2241)]|nr:hypothetical protein V493_02401 [Pseudogymnoascus sp. VKM F-4281 (FW-2241)]